MKKKGQKVIVEQCPNTRIITGCMTREHMRVMAYIICVILLIYYRGRNTVQEKGNRKFNSDCHSGDIIIIMKLKLLYNAIIKVIFNLKVYYFSNVPTYNLNIYKGHTKKKK